MKTRGLAQWTYGRVEAYIGIPRGQGLFSNHAGLFLYEELPGKLKFAMELRRSR